MCRSKPIERFDVFAGAVFTETSRIIFRHPARYALLQLMNVDVGIWGKLTRVVIALLVIALLAGIWQWYLPLIKQNERMRRDALNLDNKIQKEEATQKQLKSSIDTLRYDTNAVERLAREKLHYAKAGEIVVDFQSPATNQMTR
jgi:cell division protein FtsB